METEVMHTQVSSNCQAKAQVQVQSLKSKSKVKSKVLSQKDLDFAYSIIKEPTTTTTTRKLLMTNQKSYSQVLYLFGNLSWLSTRIASHLQIFANYFAIHFCKGVNEI